MAPLSGGDRPVLDPSPGTLRDVWFRVVAPLLGDSRRLRFDCMGKGGRNPGGLASMVLQLGRTKPAG